MLNIMPATTAVVPQFIHNFIIKFLINTLAQLSSRLLPSKKILQEYQESYKSVFARLIHSCKERTISLTFCKILQESCRNLACVLLLVSCKILASTRMCKSCKDTLVRLVLLGVFYIVVCCSVFIFDIILLCL